MGLKVYWYDIVCFGIVGVSWCSALWVIWKKEGPSEDSTAEYETVLLEVARPRGQVGKRELWKSCWNGVDPKWLLLTRCVSFLVLSAFLAWDILQWGASIFIYYTEWTFALVILYFGLGILVSAHGCWVRPSHSSNTDDVEVEHKHPINKNNAGFWGYLMLTLFQTCAGAVILTDVVFWCIIVPFLSNTTHLGLDTLMGCMHTLNAAFLLLDTALNSLPFPWFRVAYFVLWSCLYVIFQWVIHACGFSWWPYPFLQLGTPWAPLWYFCLALIHIPCYGIYALIVKAKYKMLPTLFPHAFVRPY